MPARKKNHKKNNQSARKTLKAHDKLRKERFPMTLRDLAAATIESEARKKLSDIIKDLHVAADEASDGSTMYVENGSDKVALSARRIKIVVKAGITKAFLATSDRFPKDPRIHRSIVLLVDCFFINSTPFGEQMIRDGGIAWLVERLRECRSYPATMNSTLVLLDAVLSYMERNDSILHEMAEPVLVAAVPFLRARSSFTKIGCLGAIETLCIQLEASISTITMDCLLGRLPIRQMRHDFLCVLLRLARDRSRSWSRGECCRRSVRIHRKAERLSTRKAHASCASW